MEPDRVAPDGQRVHQLLTGQRGGEDVCLAYVGPARGMTYLAAYVADRLFDRPADPPGVASERQGPLPPRPTVQPDLTLTVGDAAAIAGPAGPGVLRMPFRVNLVADLRPGPDAVTRLLSRNRRRAHAQLVRRHGYTFRISHSDAEFLQFYDRMYLPTMEARHGASARTAARDAALEEIFRRGGLLIVASGGTAVAGLAFRIDHKARVVHSRLGGVLDGSEVLWRQGAFRAADHFLYEWAVGEHIDWIDLQGCEPFLGKGSLQGKVALGGAVVLPLDRQDRHLVRFQVHRDTPELRSFLAANPPIVFGTDGRMGVVYFCDADHPPELGIPRPRGLAYCQTLELDGFLAGLPGQR